MDASDVSRAAGRHLFAFDEDLASWLRASFSRLAVDDSSEAVDIDGSSGYRYLLLATAEHSDRAGHVA